MAREERRVEQLAAAEPDRRDETEQQVPQLHRALPEACGAWLVRVARGFRTCRVYAWARNLIAGRASRKLACESGARQSRRYRSVIPSRLRTQRKTERAPMA